MDNLPAGFELEESKPPQGASYLPDGFVEETPDINPVKAAGSPDWQTMAAKEIQRQQINPNDPSDLSQAKAIQNAYAQQYAGGPTMQVQQAKEQQAMQRQTNSQRGVLASNLIEALHPAGELMARGEKLLAPAVGLVAPGAAANMQASAQELEQTRGNGGITSLPGQIVGSLPTFANPIVAGVSGANRAYTETEQDKSAGADIGGWNEFARVAGQGVIDATLSKVFSAAPGSAPLAGQVEKMLAQKLQQIGPEILARYGAKGAMGALTNELGNEASNLLFGRDLGTGAKEALAIGGALPIVHEGASNILQRMRSGATAAEPPPPAGFVPEEAAPEPQPAAAPEQRQVPQQENFPDTSDLLEKIRNAKSSDEAFAAVDARDQEQLANRPKYEGPERRQESVDPGLERRMPHQPGEPNFNATDQAAEDILAARTDEEANTSAQRHLDAQAPEEPAGPPESEISLSAPATQPEGEPEKPLLRNMRKGAIAILDISSALNYGHEMVREVGKLTGSDVGLGKTGVKTANDIRGLYGEQERQGAILEDTMAPHVKAAEGMPEANAIRLVDELSAGQPPSDPQFQKFADVHRQLAAGYETRAKALGWDTSKWTPDWIGRMFEFPDAKGKFSQGNSAKLAGSEGYLKGRTFDTYSDALAAVKQAGGRPKYDNPIKMALAKDIEVSNSLLAHEQFQKFVGQGDVREVTKGTPLKPGESLIRDPMRWTHSDVHQFAAPKDVADLLNHVSSEATGSKIADMATGANRLATRVQMAINLRHYMTESLGATQQLYGQAFKDLFRGQFKQAGKEALQGTPGLGTIATLMKGKSLEPTSLEARAIAKGGGDTGQGRSILQDSDWKGMHDAWNQGKGLKAASELVGNVVGFANKVLFEKYIPTLRKGVAAMLAESEIANTTKGGGSLDTPEFSDVMNKHIQTISNVMGVEDSRIHFQNKTAATVGRMMFGLPNWFLGKARFTADAVKGLAPLFKGKNADPATYSALGAIATTGAVGTALYVAFNGGKLPTSWNDLRHVPTPWTDDDGKPIRITVPYPWEMISDVAEGERSIPETLHNRFSPLMKFAEEMYTGKDFRGAPTRETWGDVAKSLRDTMATPYSVSGFNRGDLSPGFKAAALAGITPSAKKFGQSPAERFAYETIQGKRQTAPKTHEQIAEEDTRSTLLRALRKEDYGPLDQAMEAGTVTPQQAKSLTKASQAPRGLVGLVQSHELTHQDLMGIWQRSSPAEKKMIYDPLYSRLAKETSLTPDQKESLLEKLDRELSH